MGPQLWAEIRQLAGGWLEPRSRGEDIRRREFIFKVLVTGMTGFAGAVFGRVVIEVATEGAAYHGEPIWLVAVPLVGLLALCYAGRRQFNNLLSFGLLALLVATGTYMLWRYGYELPEGLLTYALVTVMAGVLISVRGAFVMVGLIAGCLALLGFLQGQEITHPDVSRRFDPLSLPDVLIYILMLGMIGLVSWLFSRDLERSLERARRSEAALRRQRGYLEEQVRIRTRELEQAQAEKLLELQRFAEFGRLSATLLHELANPLTAVSLDLEQLARNRRSALVRQMQQGVALMEQYVEAARRQLRDHGELKYFDSTAEIKKIVALLQGQARHRQVVLETRLAAGAQLYGDSIHFEQMVSNLIANAIDAYEDLSAVTDKRSVLIMSRHRGEHVELIVQDWGSGIPAVELQRIFEPFYTTKDVRRGTGIGLAIVKRIVEEEFKGRITIKSTKRAGTCFTVRLPVR